MIEKYMTDDGMWFTDKDEALAHEKELENQKSEEAKLAEQKETRLAELNEARETALKAYDNYVNIRDKFYEDYPRTDKSLLEFIESIFG